MINLFPLTKVITTLCAIYAFILFTIFSFSGNSLTSSEIFRYASLFEFLIFMLFTIGWKWIWKVIPKLNDLIFPNLNGEWDVKINWCWKKDNETKEGTVNGKVYIKQTFLTLSMELITEESESETLAIHPKRQSESGRLVLYYTYLNTPKNTLVDSKPHRGTAILKLDFATNDKLEGNYFTDRYTKGTLELNKKI
ncbi:hypothetical protein [Arcobacter aquimarinus]|uniref:Cap15 family cyclic dinucleotide receptor domain-containing protein n=1 Tax=Arcobacter aquimarinus TaxID=1315211 RepID=UPI003BAF1E82